MHYSHNAKSPAPDTKPRKQNMERSRRKPWYIYRTYICSISYPSLPCKRTHACPQSVFTSKGKQAHILFLYYYSRTASELRLLVCKEGRLSELPLAVYVVAATAAHWRRRAAHGGQSESKRERGREAAAALLGTTKSIESRRDFPHFISAWPPPAFR